MSSGPCRRRHVGLVVVGVSDRTSQIEQAMERAERAQTKQLDVDLDTLEGDAR